MHTVGAPTSAEAHGSTEGSLLPTPAVLPQGPEAPLERAQHVFPAWATPQTCGSAGHSVPVTAQGSEWPGCTNRTELTRQVGGEMPTELLPTELTLLYTLLARPAVPSLHRRLWGLQRPPFTVPPAMFHPRGRVSRTGRAGQPLPEQPSLGLQGTSRHAVRVQLPRDWAPPASAGQAGLRAGTHTAAPGLGGLAGDPGRDPHPGTYHHFGHLGHDAPLYPPAPGGWGQRTRSQGVTHPPPPPCADHSGGLPAAPLGARLGDTCKSPRGDGTRNLSKQVGEAPPA